VGPHGVKGALRVKSFAAVAADLAAYGALTDERGKRRFALELIGETRGAVIVRIEGIDDRDAAEALRGMRLFVRRSALPEPEPESFYQVDLIGLRAVDVSGRTVGEVRAVHDLPSSAVIEIATDDGGELLVPFTRHVVPSIDLAHRLMVVDPPQEVMAR
jgi:16S rRNA processing protein RimM